MPLVAYKKCIRLMVFCMMVLCMANVQAASVVYALADSIRKGSVLGDAQGIALAFANMNTVLPPLCAIMLNEAVGKSLIKSVPLVPKKFKQRVAIALNDGFYNALMHAVLRHIEDINPINGWKLVGAHVATDLVVQYGADWLQDELDKKENEKEGSLPHWVRWAAITAATQMGFAHIA